MMTQYVLVHVFAHSLRFRAVRHDISMRLRLQGLDEQSVKVGVPSDVAITTIRGLTYHIECGTPGLGVRVCSVYISRRVAHRSIPVTVISRLALIASDALVLLVTWWQLRGTLGMPGERRVPSALVALLLRDSEHDAYIL